MRAAILIFAGLLLTGCAAPLRLEGSSFDVRRTDGSTIHAAVVSDTSLPEAAQDAIALCVDAPGIDPSERLEDLAGACAAGCQLLLVQSSERDDHARVLDRYLQSRDSPPRTVIVIGIDAGSDLAIAIANADKRVSHLALLGPPESIEPKIDDRVNAFIGLIGGTESSSSANVTVRSYPAADAKWREIGTGRTIRPLIEMDLIAWLTDTGALTSERARKLADRVRDNHREWYGSSNSK